MEIELNYNSTLISKNRTRTCRLCCIYAGTKTKRSVTVSGFSTVPGARRLFRYVGVLSIPSWNCG